MVNFIVAPGSSGENRDSFYSDLYFQLTASFGARRILFRAIQGGGGCLHISAAPAVSFCSNILFFRAAYL